MATMIVSGKKYENSAWKEEEGIECDLIVTIFLTGGKYRFNESERNIISNLIVYFSKKYLFQYLCSRSIGFLFQYFVYHQKSQTIY